MREFRSPNPLVDCRRPRDAAAADLNPPGFVWRPIPDAVSYELRIDRDAGLRSTWAHTYPVTGRTLWLYPEALAPGTYYWAWRALGCGQDERWSEVFGFTVAAETARLDVPAGSEAARLIPPEHPRHMLPAGRLEAFRQRCREGDLRPEWEALHRQTEARLREDFRMTEPPFLPDRAREHDRWGRLWRDAMNHSRQFGQDAQLFALVGLIGAEERFGRAAVERLLELARWDPDGSTSIPHNDEPHMSVINLGSRAYDWAHGFMTDAERGQIRDALAARAARTYDLLVRQDYGVVGSSSHSGRMLGFLGELAIVLAGEVEAVPQWLDFVLPTTAAMYPWWGGQDGGWAEGVSYSTAYVNLFLHFVFGLREATGIDFYRKPFFRHHGEWRLMSVPPNAYLVPFGDGRTNGRGAARASWGIQRHLGRIYGDARFLQHADQILAATGGQIQESAGLYSPLSFLTPPLSASEVNKDEQDEQDEEAGRTTARQALDIEPVAARRRETQTHAPQPVPSSHSSCSSCSSLLTSESLTRNPKSAARLFADIGWVVIRTNLREPQEDVRFMMRASPYGTTSHSHADQTSFALEAFGEPLAIPSGLYNLYSSAHHHGWTRQTRAHNGVTFDGAGQTARNPAAVGRFTRFYTDERVTYAEGDASAAYGDRVREYRRSVLCLDNRVFALVDRMELPREALWRFHLHAARPIALDEARHRAVLRYDRAALDVVLSHRSEMRFRVWDGFEIPTFGIAPGEEPEEAARYHLDAYPGMPRASDALLTVLFPRKVEAPSPEIVPLLDGRGEGVRITTTGATYTIFIRSAAGGIDINGCRSDAEIVALLGDASGAVRRAVQVGGTALEFEHGSAAEEGVTRIV